MMQDTLPQKTFQRAFGRFTILVILAFFTLLVRLWYLQIIQGPQLTERSEANRIRVYRIVGPRGNIFDRHGEMLVDNRPSFNVIFNPAAVAANNRDAFLSGICRQIACDVELAKARLEKRPGAIRLIDDITRDDLARVQTMRMFYEGEEFPLSVEQAGRRIFKYGSLLAHVIGYTGEIDQDRLSLPEYAGYLPGDRVGRTGIEMSYEQNLRGEFGVHKIEENARGMQIRSLEYKPAEAGKNLILNLDLELQRIAARALAGQAGAVVALDPRNGQVLALHSAPTFDPDLFARAMSKGEWDALANDPRHPLQNKAIAGLYPPGSTFKVVAALGGLQEGEIDFSTPFECRGKWRFGGRDFRCHNDKGHGLVAFQASIMRSCDIYYYRLSVRLGIERLAKYGRLLGGGRKSGIDMPGEQDGLIPDPEWKRRVHHKEWLPGETLNTAIGQGSVMMTPLQLAVMYATVANRGTIYKPQVVGRVVAPNGNVVQEFQPVILGQLDIREIYFRELQRALTLVVNSPGGSAYKARIRSLLVAGKTGTAQVRRIGKQRLRGAAVPYEHRDHAWFVGFAPADNPEIVVVAMVEHGGFGSQVAAPVAMQVISRYAQLRHKKTVAAPVIPAPAAIEPEPAPVTPTPSESENVADLE
jgi:penicillin-binding protein 2